MGVRKTGRHASDVERRASRPSASILVLFILLLTASTANGLGVSSSRAPRERALGIDRSAATVIFDLPIEGTDLERWKIEAGQWDLYGIEGVYGAAVSIERYGGDLQGFLRLGRLSTPVGRESDIALGILTRAGGRLWTGVSLRLEIAEIDECTRSHLLSASPCVLFRVGPDISLVSVIRDVGLFGEDLAGANASLRVVAGADRRLCAAASLTAARDGAFSVGVSSRLRFGRDLVLSTGYDEGTGAFDGSLVIRVRSLGVDAGATAHPVLGVSKAVFVSWGRGW